MLYLSVTSLALMIVILTLGVGAIAYMVGHIIGQKTESDRIVNYCVTHNMNLTGELLRDNYPIIFQQCQKTYMSPMEIALKREGVTNG
jgi:hypothetical protein